MSRLANFKNRNHFVDFLRFFAASWVVLFHFNTPVPHLGNWYRNFTSIGYLGVPIFFVVSGYCIQIAVSHSKTAFEFVIKRFARIFIPYWFSLLLVFVTAIVIKLIYGVNFVATFPKSLLDLLCTITLLTSPVTKTPLINWVYWTLSYEIFFYFIIAIGLGILPKKYSIWVIAISFLSVLLPKHGNWLLFFVQYWPNFSLGIIVFWLRDATKKFFLPSLILLIVTVASFYFSEQSKLYVLTSFLSAMLLFASEIKPMTDNVFSRLGNYSYSVYLIHGPVGGYLLGFVKNIKVVQTNIWLNITWDIILLAFVFWLARLTYLYIELPAIAVGKKLTTRYITT